MLIFATTYMFHNINQIKSEILGTYNTQVGTQDLKGVDSID